MQEFDTLDPGDFYHLYNHAVGGRNLFSEADNYDYFLHLYDKYISPVADTYAWALMPNHFHLLVRIRAEVCYKHSNVDGSIDAAKFNAIKWQTMNLSACETPDNVNRPKPEKHFSHLFNAYARHINLKYKKRGAMFERPFKRKRIDDEEYLKRLVLYIHNNPVHHGFCKHPLEYPWTSYHTCASDKVTKLLRPQVFDWFGGKENFDKAQQNWGIKVEEGEWLEN